MKKLTSLADLAELLPASEQKADTPKPKIGYTGKQQVLKIALDTKRRGGKTVTVIAGFQSNPTELDTIAQTLKKKCGSGGQVLDNTIEIQGDHRIKAGETLLKLGFLIQ
ncbi:MAG: translation initiation factor [Ignavibacteria bacterium]|nr:translation initiation factor [Ignavibacteria bacterium]